MQTKNPRKVLVLGAGDGMAIREVLKWDNIQQVILIELDPVMVQLANSYTQLREVNKDAFLSHLFDLPKDIPIYDDVSINRLSHPVIVRYQFESRFIAY